MMQFSAGPFDSDTATPHDKYIVKGDIRYWKRNVVACTGTCIIIARRDASFGGDESKPYRSHPISNPTWGELFERAKAQQKRTRDLSHCYFEGYRKVGHTKKGHTLIQLVLGS